MDYFNSVPKNLSYKSIRMKIFVFVSLLLIGTGFAQVRRDDVWPPKAVIDFLTPIRTTCMGKTGVTAGNRNNELK